MSNLSLRHIYKVYPNGVKAVNDFSMEIEDKEFIVFVGPSGCGKSTTLRMIAGLEEITAGELYIGDSFVNHVEPKDRDIAMVFQNYALYPHMTVYENLAFGLKLRHVPQSEIHKKVLWAAKILRLSDLLDRKPKALSGGQRQRVSLGRAILRTPKVFLLDEPLSNLDAKLRTEMRAEIAKLHKEIATTFIYVTHDQVEAMTMGTRIVVMNLGYIQQIDTPKNLYDYPENKFVAGFIGTPQMNFFKAKLLRQGQTVKVTFEGCDSVLEVPFEKMMKVRHEYLEGDRTVIVGLRCEHISADKEVVEKSNNRMKVKVSHFEELGHETLIYGDLDMSGDGLSESNTRVIVKKYGGDHECRIGDVIDVAFDMDKAHFFDSETEKTIAPRIPVENVFDATIAGSEVSFLDQKLRLPGAIVAPDCKDALLIIPTDALTEGGKDITATVTGEEIVKGTRIVYLQTENRTFFMISDKPYAVGQKLELGVDYKRIAIQNRRKEELVTPLPEHDIFYGSYFDRANAKRSVAQLAAYYQDTKAKQIASLKKQMQEQIGMVTFQESLLAELKAEYAEKKKNILGEKSYRIGTESLGKEGKKKVEAEAKLALENAKKEYESKVAEYQKRKAAYANLSAAEKQSSKEQENKIREQFNEYIAAVEKRYEELIRCNEAGIAAAQQALLPLENEQAKIAAERTAAAKTAYAAKRTQTIAALDQAISQAKADIATSTGAQKDQAVIRSKEAEQAKKDGIKALEAQFNAELDEIVFESKVFNAYINGDSAVTSLDINKKIIKGLGAQLFLSHYRFEVPHDAYVIAEQGIAATVEAMVDYGTEQYALCDVTGNKIYVKVDNAVKPGTQLKLHIDVTKTEIYENRFDIRLY